MRLLHLLPFMVLIASAEAKPSLYYNSNNHTTGDCQYSYIIDDPNLSVTISTIESAHKNIKIFNASWNLIYACTDSCANPVVVNNLEVGSYILSIIYFNENSEITCITNENFEITGSDCVDVDEDGYCAFEDCNDYDASFPQEEGTPCNDYNSATINDQIQIDGCTCMGTLYQGGCNITYNLNTPEGIIQIAGLIAHQVKVDISNILNGNIAYSCELKCDNEIEIMDIAAGSYTIDVQLFDADLNNICNLNENFDWNPTACTDEDSDGICLALDCDDTNATLPGIPGAFCDDMNSATVNDIVGPDGCTCAGELYEGLCNFSYFSGLNSVSITGLIAPLVSVRLFDAEWNIVYQCYNNCDQDIEVLGLSPNEQYFLKIELFDNDQTIICAMEEYFVVQPGNTCEDIDSDGYCDDIDCDSTDPSWPKEPGTPCDDGLIETAFDVIQGDGCNCAGEEACSNIYILSNGVSLVIGGFPENYIADITVSLNSTPIFICTATCFDPTFVSISPLLDYVIHVNLLDSNWDFVCGIEATTSLFAPDPTNLFTPEDSEDGSKLAISNTTSGLKLQTTKNVNQQLGQSNVRLFPTPVVSELNIHIDAISGKESVLELYNQLGKLVKQKNVANWPRDGKLTMDCSELSHGVYYLVVRTIDGVVIREQFMR